MTDNNPNLLTVKEAAATTSLSEGQIRYALKKNLLGKHTKEMNDFPYIAVSKEDIEGYADFRETGGEPREFNLADYFNSQAENNEPAEIIELTLQARKPFAKLRQGVALKAAAALAFVGVFAAAASPLRETLVENAERILTNDPVVGVVVNSVAPSSDTIINHGKKEVAVEAAAVVDGGAKDANVEVVDHSYSYSAKGAKATIDSNFDFSNVDHISFGDAEENSLVASYNHGSLVDLQSCGTPVDEYNAYGLSATLAGNISSDTTYALTLGGLGLDGDIGLGDTELKLTHFTANDSSHSVSAFYDVFNAPEGSVVDLFGGQTPLFGSTAGHVGVNTSPGDVFGIGYEYTKLDGDSVWRAGVKLFVDADMREGGVFQNAVRTPFELEGGAEIYASYEADGFEAGDRFNVFASGRYFKWGGQNGFTSQTSTESYNYTDTENYTYTEMEPYSYTELEPYTYTETETYTYWDTSNEVAVERQGEREVERQGEREVERQGEREVERQGEREVERQGQRSVTHNSPINAKDEFQFVLGAGYYDAQVGCLEDTEGFYQLTGGLVENRLGYEGQDGVFASATATFKHELSDRFKLVAGAGAHFTNIYNDCPTFTNITSDGEVYRPVANDAVQKSVLYGEVFGGLEVEFNDRLKGYVGGSQRFGDVQSTGGVIGLSFSF